MRNHSFSSLSTAYEHDVDHRLDDDDSYDLSSLAKLNRRKPQVSTILKLNLIVVLIISLFMKLTVVSIYNGSLSAFLALKLMTHGLILYTFLKKHYISLQLLFVLDVILFVIFLLFEFLLFVSNFAIIIIQHKRNKKLGIIDIWLMILIAAIDLLILVMVAIVLENYRRPKERLQQLEAKLVTVVHGGRLLASQMCKSGSYLLGFVCNSATAANQSAQTVHRSSNNNGMLQNGTPRVYRDSSNPNQQISCIDTQEASSFSLNDDEYVHYSSLDINDDEADNRFHSFSDFYNFNNRNANQTTGRCNSPNATTVASATTVPINDLPTTTSQSSNTALLASTPSQSSPSNSTSVGFINNSNNIATNTGATLASLLNTTLTNNLATLNNLANSVTATGIPSLTTLATSSHFSTSIAFAQSSNNHLKEQNKSLFERIGTNPFKVNGFNNSTISSIVSSNTLSASNLMSNHANNGSLADEDENTYVRMYQCNVNEDGDPVDGPLRCSRTTVINNSTESGSNPTSHTVVRMSRNASERALNCKPVYI